MKNAFSISLVALSLTGCGGVAGVRQDIETQVPKTMQAFDIQAQAPEAKSRVQDMPGLMIPVKKVVLPKEGSGWLHAKHFDYYNAAVPTPISAFVAALAAKGVNVVSDLPLDGYTYTGSITSTDAESALRIVLGSAGLDYVVDEQRQIVSITPLPSKTWTLNIGKRKSSFVTGQNAGSGQYASASSNTSSGQNGTGSSTGSSNQSVSGTQSNTTGQGSTGQTGQTGSGTTGSSTGSSSNSGSNGVTNDDDFWSEFNIEMAKRMKVPLPKPTARSLARSDAAGAFPSAIPGMQFAPGAAPAAPVNAGVSSGDQLGTNDLYEMTKIGDYSLNPVTGAVRVQAPHWLLAEIDAYIREIQDMYDAVISYEGQLVLVNQTVDNSEGLDLQSFATWASGRYGAVLSNSALGGVSVNFSQGKIPAVSAPNQTIAGPLFGIVSAKDGLSAFNDYMKGTGNFTVKQRVKVQTSSGVPGSMSTMEPYPYQVVSQNAVVGNVGAAAQATNYTIQYMNFGTVMRVSPRYDLHTGKVRALVEVHNSIHSGDKSFPQTISVGSTTQTQTETIPLGKDMDISSETQMRSGDLVVLGGQTTETLQTTESGLPTADAPMGGVFGTKQSNITKGTYYFLLQMHVSKN
jgi:hypothetical protein